MKQEKKIIKVLVLQFIKIMLSILNESVFNEQILVLFLFTFFSYPFG